jgi:sugar phosphate isomerase/epimerase
MKQDLRIILSLLFLILFISCHAQSDLEPQITHPSTDYVDDWQLAMQFWTFNQFSFFEAIEKTSELGLSWIEAYPGQKLFKDNDKIVFNADLSGEYRKQIKDRLRRAGIRLINYGVVSLPHDEDACRTVFDFAKDMGIKTLISEPAKKSLEMIDELCQEYDIQVALHNHPKPSRYWDPDSVLSAVKNRSQYIGACADIGHWVRSGVDPLMSIRKLGTRVLSFHFKDVRYKNKPEVPDVLLGRGVADVDFVIEEMKRSEFKGVISLEYEAESKDLMSDMRNNIWAFYSIARAFKPFNWFNLITRDLQNCTYKPDSWTYENGILSAKGGGDLWTNDVYGNFILDLDFKLDSGTNSGIFVRTGDIVQWLHTAIEVQILDSHGKDEVTKHDCGAIFDCLEPATNAVNPPGKWNKYTITCTGNKIYVILNGEKIIDMDLNLWTEAGKNPDGTNNKFKTAYKDMPRKGHIGFQYHGHPVWFRNIRIRKLDL